MTSKRRRAYIGNLRSRPSLAENLYNNLFIPHCLPVNNYPSGDGIQIVTPRNNANGSTTVHAFVEFKDVDYAIQMLDGVKFDGKTLRVSREKSGFGNKGGGFGSAKWAGAGDREIRRPRVHQSKNNESGPTTEGEASHRGRKAVSNEISGSIDPVTSAIACTAVVSLKDQLPGKESDNIPSDGDNMSNQDFQTRCQLPLSELLNEYGEQDLDWKKLKPSATDNMEPTNAADMSSTDFMSRCKMPLSELIAEYGEQDLDWKKNQQTSTYSNKQNHEHSSNNNKQSFQNKNSDNGMLAPFDKAFIHLELVSFGYKYGAPSHSKKGFTFAHPLPPLDCRDLDRAPAHVAKFTGLSYLVKKALLNPDQSGEDEDDGAGKTRSKTEGAMRRKANKMADDIIKILVESIDEGAHGPISPLTMTVSIGSEYGRHRAVVLVEHLAVVLRARLRRNDGKGYDDGTSSSVAENGIVKQLVSVETRHRDIDARHKDEEAFGEDLKREVRAAERAKRRQDREEENW